MRERFAQYTLLALTLFYLIMLGGGNYEQLNITSRVVSALPKSLYILQGEYGFKPFAFWGLFRPLTILFFIAAIILNWRFPTMRKLLLVAFTVDVMVTIATFTYFAPETEIFLNIPYSSDMVEPSLAAKAHLWKNLNWVRLGAFYAGGILLLIALTKPRGKSVTDI